MKLKSSAGISQTRPMHTAKLPTGPSDTVFNCTIHVIWDLLWAALPMGSLATQTQTLATALIPDDPHLATVSYSVAPLLVGVVSYSHRSHSQQPKLRSAERQQPMPISASSSSHLARRHSLQSGRVLFRFVFLATLSVCLWWHDYC